MGKLEEAKGILAAIGMPTGQTNDRSGYVLLALADIKEDDLWKNAKAPALRIVDTMSFMADNYGKIYKPNTRETIRKDTMHQFVDGAVAERNSGSQNRPTNSPKYSYSLTKEMLTLIKSYGTSRWQDELKTFIDTQGSLIDKYSQKRELSRVPVKVKDKTILLSAGKHNKLQKAIIEEFAERFAKGSEILYMGDTEDKYLIKNDEVLNDLGIVIKEHDKLPDVVLYRANKNWIYFIEAVTSVGCITVKRMNEIEEIAKNSSCGKVYVSAFLNNTIFRKFMNDIAWETEVWIADKPNHMIHFNGDKFIGPR